MTKIKITCQSICFVCFLLIWVFASCSRTINDENKICIAAKILSDARFSKNGGKTFVYFYKGKPYWGTRSFDNRYFTDGDFFLICLDKTNPKNYEAPRKKQKISNTAALKILKDDNPYIFINEEDLDKLDSITSF